MSNDRSKALDVALAAIDKQFGKGSIMRMGEKGSMVVEAVQTGALALDLALDLGARGGGDGRDDGLGVADERHARRRDDVGEVQHVAPFERGDVDRLILSRPAVEAGEALGFLPGDLHEKLTPFKLTLKMRSQSSSVASRTVPKTRTPALATNASMRPKASMVSRAKRRHSFSFETSARR